MDVTNIEYVDYKFSKRNLESYSLKELRKYKRKLFLCPPQK